MLFVKHLLSILKALQSFQQELIPPRVFRILVLDCGFENPAHEFVFELSKLQFETSNDSGNILICRIVP